MRYVLILACPSKRGPDWRVPVSFNPSLSSASLASAGCGRWSQRKTYLSPAALISPRQDKRTDITIKTCTCNPYRAPRYDIGWRPAGMVHRLPVDGGARQRNGPRSIGRCCHRRSTNRHWGIPGLIGSHGCAGFRQVESRSKQHEPRAFRTPTHRPSSLTTLLQPLVEGYPAHKGPLPSPQIKDILRCCRWDERHARGITMNHPSSLPKQKLSNMSLLQHRTFRYGTTPPSHSRCIENATAARTCKCCRPRVYLEVHFLPKHRSSYSSQPAVLAGGQALVPALSAPRTTSTPTVVLY
ncbi:hypothetical protein B0H66DRAFT_74816 [Apodospora peruviana]|uniref:Uncharacterized protein n=1 Tax=Apodospora peruviana TaxID=516989 RepID=A0AAE0IT85_9PEZI|nr:hypothetical protein B0H66DRAFT_74816 [Apodospora peruviana]